jgi:hypothetical protein
MNNEDGTSFLSSLHGYASNINISKRPAYQQDGILSIGKTNPLDYAEPLKSGEGNYGNNYSNNVLVPFVSDSYLQMSDLQYLKNRVLDQISTNYMMGSLGMGANP